MERKIGEVFYDSTGKKVKTCLGNETCNMCIYRYSNCDVEKKEIGMCSSVWRSDNQDVIFKEENDNEEKNIKIMKKTITGNSNEYNKDNFYKNTFGVFEQINLSNSHFDLSNPDFISESGSRYYYSGDRLYRYSNHWDWVASCMWKIHGKYNAKKGWKLGVIRFSKLEKYNYEVRLNSLFSDDFLKKFHDANKLIPTTRVDLKCIKLYNSSKRLNFIKTEYREKYKWIQISLKFGIITNFEIISYKDKNSKLIKDYIANVEKIATLKIDELINKYNLSK